MQVDCGIVKKYFTDRGFGFVGHTFLNTPSREVFFHIKKIKKEYPELARELEDKEFMGTIYFWYEIESSEKGEFVCRVLAPELIFQKYTAKLPIFTEKIECIWRNIDLELHDFFKQITIDLLGDRHTQELNIERNNLEYKRKEENEKLQI